MRYLFYAQMTIQQIIDEQMQEFDKQFMIERITKILISDEDKYTYIAKPIDLKGHEAAEAIKFFILSYTRKIIETVGEELIGEDEKPLFSERYETAGHQDKSLRKRGRNELRSIQRLKLKEIINSLK